MKPISKTVNRATIKDIALRAGVSRSTVSRVLAGSPHVRAEKRTAVNRAIEEMNYRPSPVARSLATGFSPTIQVIVSDVRNPVYAEMLRGVEDIARVSEYTVVVGNSDDSYERELEYLHVAKENNVSGIIMISAVGGRKVVEVLSDLARPVVLVNRLIPNYKTDAVVVDNERGAYRATKYLLDLGHRKIFHLAGFKKSSASYGRLQGFLKAMRETGLEVSSDSVVHGDLRIDSGESIGRQLVDEGLKYTAVFAANDQMAIGLMAAFASRDVRVPEDISLIGFDDMAYSGLPHIWLTTMRQPQYEMGKTAARMLLERVKGETSEFRTAVFECELIERKTCTAPKGSE